MKARIYIYVNVIYFVLHLVDVHNASLHHSKIGSYFFIHITVIIMCEFVIYLL